jgi:hypothetical protein
MEIAIFIILALGTLGLGTTLLLSLNNIIKTIYYWQREVTFTDHVNPKKIHIQFPNEALTSDSLSKDICTDELYEKLELLITDNESSYVPYKSMITGIIDIFLDYRNVIGALQNAEEEYKYDTEELELFKSRAKFDLPSIIRGNEVYNMYTLYSLYDIDTQKEIIITSPEDYSAFVRKVIENKSNLSYRTNYMVYKKIGNKEDGLLVSELTTTFNIGQMYQDQTRTKNIIDVRYPSEIEDARKN